MLGSVLDVLGSVLDVLESVLDVLGSVLDVLGSVLDCAGKCPRLCWEVYTVHPATILVTYVSYRFLIYNYCTETYVY